jgi:hypothetical protein
LKRASAHLPEVRSASATRVDAPPFGVHRSRVRCEALRCKPSCQRKVAHRGVNVGRVLEGLVLLASSALGSRRGGKLLERCDRLLALCRGSGIPRPN